MFNQYIDPSNLDEIVTNLSPAIVNKKVMKLLFKQQYKQRTDEWYVKRQSILTASDAAAALNQNKYQSREKLIKKKAGLVGKHESGMSAACEHGIKYEDEAANIYATRNPHLCPFFELGLIMHDTHRFLGASPDRVTKDGILIEIKVRHFIWLFYQLIFFSYFDKHCYRLPLFFLTLLRLVGVLQ